MAIEKPKPIDALIGRQSFWRDYLRPPATDDEVLDNQSFYPELEACRIGFWVTEDTGLVLNLDEELCMPKLDLYGQASVPYCIAWNPEGPFGERYDPILRWEELDIFCRCVATKEDELYNISILLLHPFAPICLEDDARRILAILRSAWRSLGLFSDKEIARFITRFDRRKAGFFWKGDIQQGWTLWKERDRFPRGVSNSMRCPGSPFRHDVFQGFMAEVQRHWQSVSRTSERTG
ncbi:MAG: hypothetical protein U0835_07820 [Isosphaeraceae bacterium]